MSPGEGKKTRAPKHSTATYESPHVYVDFIWGRIYVLIHFSSLFYLII